MHVQDACSINIYVVCTVEACLVVDLYTWFRMAHKSEIIP